MSAVTSGVKFASVETSLSSASVQLTNSYPSSALALEPVTVISSALRLTVSLSEETLPPFDDLYVIVSSFDSSAFSSVVLKFAVKENSVSSVSAEIEGTYLASVDTSSPSLFVQLTNSYPSSALASDPSKE